MAKFITNIELQNADEKDYEVLHNELEKESFKDEKPLSKSKTYVTSKGTFSREGNVTLQQVTDAVSRAASKTGKKFSFFIIKNKHIAN